MNRISRITRMLGIVCWLVAGTVVTTVSAQQTVLFSDNFNSADAEDVSAGITTNRQTGTLATATYNEYYTPNNTDIVSQQLQTGGGAGVFNNADLKADLTNNAAFDGFTMKFDLKNTGSSWAAYFLSTHAAADERGVSEYGFHLSQQAASGAITLYGGTGSSQVVHNVTRTDLTTALGSTFNANEMHSYKFVATPANTTQGTYNFYVDNNLVFTNKAYMLGSGGSNGQINWEVRTITGGIGVCDNLEIATFIIPPAGTVIILR